VVESVVAWVAVVRWSHSNHRVISLGRAGPLSLQPSPTTALRRGYESVAKRAVGANVRRAFCVSYRHFGDDQSASTNVPRVRTEAMNSRFG
jgi:hypothetical protein